jgi:hypothetical protein
MFRLAPAAVAPVPAVSPTCRPCKRYSISVPSPLRGFSSKTETDTQVTSSPSPTPTDRRAQSLPAAEVRISTFGRARPAGRSVCPSSVPAHARRHHRGADLAPQNGGMNHGRQAPYATPLRRRSRLRSPVLSDTSTQQAVARLVWFRRKTDMDKTRFFTEQVTSGSRGEASDEDMQRRITDFGAEEMRTTARFSCRREAAGLSAGPKAGSLGPYVACDAVGGRAAARTS